MVSVVIPTYRRRTLLVRAIESVRSQTFANWELVVSDDESEPGETWAYLQELTKTDARIRVLRNACERGQVGNTNNGLLNARGTWIKPLHDDDVLKPHCLERLVAAVEGMRDVAVVSSTATYFQAGRLRKSDQTGRSPLEVIKSRYVPLAMYLQEAGAGEPTCVMVHRRIIEAGTLFEDVEGLTSGVDSDWNARASVHGDLLLVNEPLVELHDEGHARVTTMVTDQDLDKEYEVMRRRQFELIDPALKPPSVEVVIGMLRVIRAMHRIKNRKFREGLMLARQATHLESWLLAFRWALRQVFPGAACKVKRFVPDPEGTDPVTS
jgi:glycosyltransferase involved in cell wall biosynthesis